MALTLIGGRDTCALEAILPASGTGFCEWRGTPPPWVTMGATSLGLPPGRYRVESQSGFTFYLLNPWENQGVQGPDVLIQHATRSMQIYAGQDKAGTFFITRLA